jgi:hypothetical protein
MTTTDDLETQLSEAQTALHKLMTGQGVVRLMYDAKEVIYTPANIGDLRAYILELQVQLGQKTGRCKASRVWF